MRLCFTRISQINPFCTFFHFCRLIFVLRWWNIVEEALISHFSTSFKSANNIRISEKLQILYDAGLEQCARRVFEKCAQSWAPALPEANGRWASTKKECLSAQHSFDTHSDPQVSWNVIVKQSFEDRTSIRKYPSLRIFCNCKVGLEVILENKNKEHIINTFYYAVFWLFYSNR